MDETVLHVSNCFVELKMSSIKKLLLLLYEQQTQLYFGCRDLIVASVRKFGAPLKSVISTYYSYFSRYGKFRSQAYAFYC